MALTSRIMVSVMGRTLLSGQCRLAGSLYVSYYGCDQSQVQRQLCAANQRDGQIILLLNGLLRFPLVLLYCLIGVGIAAYATSHDFCRRYRKATAHRTSTWRCRY